MTHILHPMRIIIPFFVAMVLMFDVSAKRANATESSRTTVIACAPEDAFSDALREWVVGVADGADSTAADREKLGIAALPDTAIVFVADSVICETAARQHAIAAHQDTLTPPPVHLLRLGSTRYIAFNGVRAGEFSVYFVFDQLFDLKTSFMM